MAARLVGFPDNHLHVNWSILVPLMNRRGLLLIFSALKQHENKTAATHKTNTNKMK